jgi:hypothetical protein
LPHASVRLGLLAHPPIRVVAVGQERDRSRVGDRPDPVAGVVSMARLATRRVNPC